MNVSVNTVDIQTLYRNYYSDCEDQRRYHIYPGRNIGQQCRLKERKRDRPKRLTYILCLTCGITFNLFIWTKMFFKRTFKLFVTPWTVAHQVPPSMGFSGKNTGVGCHFLLQGTFLTQGLNLCSPALAESLPTEPLGKPFERSNVIHSRMDSTLLSS